MDLSLTPINVSCSFLFEIPNFLQRQENSGVPLYSPNFFVIDSKNNLGEFALKIYPKGENKNYYDYVSCYLNNCSDTVLNLSYTVSIVDENGTKRVEGCIKNKDFSKGKSWGLSKFVSKDFLKREANNLLPNNTLKVILEISKPGPEPVDSCFVRQLEKSYTDMKYPDMLINCNKLSFECHRFLLSARSPVLNEMLLNGSHAREMLSFIYCGKIKDVKSNAKELLKAADNYQIDNLKELCGYYLSERLNLTNCLDNLVMADKYGEDNLKKTAMEFLVKNIKAVMKTPKWKVIGKKKPELMMEVTEALVDKIVL